MAKFEIRIDECTDDEWREFLTRVERGLPRADAETQEKRAQGHPVPPTNTGIPWMAHMYAMMGRGEN